MTTKKQFLAVLMSFMLIVGVGPLGGCRSGQPVRADARQTTQSQQQVPPTTYATPTADQLYQLVAPIALFPDNLVAQVLAASTYPDQVVAANKWLQQNSGLKGDQLMHAANQQSWDDSVKGLTQFADVLNQMATNLSWTSALGDAYVNVPQDVMNAVQVMRQRAHQAGNLKTNQNQDVTVQNQAPASGPSEASQPTVVTAPPQTIIIEPAQPDVVYVPTYDPTLVYGAPVALYPGYSTGALVATSMISFGVGVAVGAALSGGCCGWGWNSWGCGWHNSTVIYNHNTWVSNSNTFVNRNNYYNRNFNNANNFNRNNLNANNINRNNVNRNNLNGGNYRANNFAGNNARGGNFTTPTFNQKYNQPQFNRSNVGQGGQKFGGANQNRSNLSQAQHQSALGYGQADRGTRSGAFSNYGPGGNARMNSARGQQSLGRSRGGASRQPHAAGGRRR
ncbi:MAG TPA: DUF3300 domain-containing protein [Candidatus Cybelea sp.]|nr:DUF3300 domain-containing protein [Candidatus Cybelea sp.]